MALFEGSAKSLLQGVSQQIPRERQDGQVSAQLNMMSDPVSNVRRRPGCQWRQNTTMTSANVHKLTGFETDIGGYTRQFLIDTEAGVVRLYDQNFVLEQTLAANSYLVAADARAIRVATVGDTLFLANVEKKPIAGASTGLNPQPRAWFYVRAGALNKTYHVKIDYGTGSITGSYTTPNGTTAGDAAQATPEYIADQLENDLIAAGVSGVSITRTGQYVYVFESSGSITAQLTSSSESGDAFMVCSGAMYLTDAALLPAQLPAGADGSIVATGSLQAPSYFKYVAAKMAWLECGDFESPGSLTQMPVRIRRNAGDTAWEYDTTPYEGRLAGDDTTSPDPNFLTRGITGLSSYQGRLVILSGNRVCMSAANRPLRFYRSTVTTIVDADCIEVGAQGNSSAAYEYAEQFQKDLVLFSSRYQALVPAMNTGLTPRTAQVVVTSSFAADMTTGPVVMGRTLMYPSPRSSDFFGILEMLPSPYTDSQYVSTDVTVHLPKYMPGKCRFGVSSSVANIGLFGSTGDLHSVIVHEYLWDGDEKRQQAWHTWTFPFPVAKAYFSSGLVVLVMVNGNNVVHATLDPRSGTLTAESQVRPFLDLYYFDSVVDNAVTLDSWLTTFDPNARNTVLLSNAEDELAGELVGVADRSTDTLITVPSFPDGAVSIGYPFRSSIVPSAPMVKDANGVKISSNKLSILRFMVGTRGSAEFEVIVRDNATLGPDEPQQVPTLYWSSRELELGMPRIDVDNTSIIPCRTAADTTVMEIFTEGVQELNVVSLEFACRYNQKHTRR